MAYRKEQERLAREEARKSQEEIEQKALEEAARLEEKGQDEKAEEVIAYAENIQALPEPVKQSYGGVTGASSSTTKRWKARITDIAALAASRPECITVNNTVLMALFRGGVKRIDGVEFYQEESISIRYNNTRWWCLVQYRVRLPLVARSK